MEFILNILLTFITIMQFAIIARAIMSWFDRSMRNPISQILVQLTEPIIAPIRRFVPQAGMIDFSPLVALLILLVIRQMLLAAVLQ